MADDADVIIVGAGLAGLVAAAELAEAAKTIIIVDQEPEQSLGGQAFWSLGGIFLVDSPEQRKMRIHDAYDLALEDWMGTAGFDREEDHWPRKWARQLRAKIPYNVGNRARHSRAFRRTRAVGRGSRAGYLQVSPPGPRTHQVWRRGRRGTW